MLDLAAKLELEEPWRTALILPAGYEDFGRPLRRLRMGQPGEPKRLAFRLQVRRVPLLREGTGEGATLVAQDEDKATVLCMLGRDNPAALLAKLQAGDDVLVLGTPYRETTWSLRRAELVDPRWEGRLRPVYPKVRGWHAGVIRRSVLVPLGRNLRLAARHLAEVVPDRLHGPRARSVEARTDGFARLLREAHLPATVASGERAMAVLDQAAARATVARLRTAAASVRVRWRGEVAIEARAGMVPLALTPSQFQACREIASNLASDRPMRRLLVGDVGSGKTAVYAIVAAAAADRGCGVGIMLPSTVLAAQVHGELVKWFPDLIDELALVTSTQGRQRSHRTRIVVGTTALLHRVLAERDLAIVDEQQRFGRAQRDALGGATAHVLEVTATPIPRSLALARLGLTEISRLEGTFVRKRIHTRLHTAQGRRALMEDALRTVGAGGQVLVIYPARSGNRAEMRNVEEEGARWERYRPGRCRLVHGGMSEAAKNAALEAIRAGVADILVATTVVEVGVDLPELRRVIVVHAERFGLTSLHQLRGRVARRGGLGFCDLYLPRPVSPESFERLRVLTRESDGLRIAEADLDLRNCGELVPEGARQSGSVGNLLPLRPLNLEAVVAGLDAVVGGRAAAAAGG